MMTSLSINCNMPPPDWSSIQEGKEGRQDVTERSEKKKKKKKKKKNRNKIKLKAKQIQKREKIDKEIKRRKIQKIIIKKITSQQQQQHDESYSLNCCCCDVTDKPSRSGATWRLVDNIS